MDGKPSRFSAYDILRRNEKCIDSTLQRLKTEDLGRRFLYRVEEAMKTNRNNIHLVLKQMINSFDHTYACGNIDRARWMSFQLQRAIKHRKTLQDTQYLTKTEESGLIMRIHNLHQENKDVPEADRVRRQLLHSDLRGSLSQTDLAVLFDTSIERCLRPNSGNMNQVGETRSFLHYLAELGDVSLFPIFQEVAARDYCPGPDFIGQSLLHVAAAHGHAELVGNLLSLERSHKNFKLGIESRDEAGMTAILLAISNGQYSSYQVLRKANARLDVRSETSHTPLGMAARMNQVGLSGVWNPICAGAATHVVGAACLRDIPCIQCVL